MKNQAILSFVIIILILASCAVRNVTSHNPTIVEEPYADVLVLYVEGVSAGLYGLDKASYNKYLRYKFNDVQAHSFREDLSNAFLVQLPHVRIVGKDSFFDHQQDYTFSEFMEAIRDNGVRSLILVSTDERNALGNKINQLSRYQSYMLDLEKNQLIWFQGADIVSSNLYDVPFAKRIAKLAAKDLIKNNIVLNKE